MTLRMRSPKPMFTDPKRHRLWDASKQWTWEIRKTLGFVPRWKPTFMRAVRNPPKIRVSKHRAQRTRIAFPWELPVSSATATGVTLANTVFRCVNSTRVPTGQRVHHRIPPMAIGVCVIDFIRVSTVRIDFRKRVPRIGGALPSVDRATVMSLRAMMETVIRLLESVPVRYVFTLFKKS